MNATINKAMPLPAEALALLQQASVQMHKALAVLEQAQHRALTVADLHALTGPSLRAATAVKRAGTATQTAIHHQTNA